MAADKIITLKHMTIMIQYHTHPDHIQQYQTNDKLGQDGRIPLTLFTLQEWQVRVY